MPIGRVIPDDERRRIKQAVKDGMPPQEVADQHGVSYPTVVRIAREPMRKRDRTKMRPATCKCGSTGWSRPGSHKPYRCVDCNGRRNGKNAGYLVASLATLRAAGLEPDHLTEPCGCERGTVMTERGRVPCGRCEGRGFLRPERARRRA